MDPQTKDRIEAVRQEVHGCKEMENQPDRKDALQALLDHAYRTANGTPDKIEEIAQSISVLLVHMVRNETREPKRVKEIVDNAIGSAIEKHIVNCPVQKAPRTLKGAALQVAAQYPLIVTLSGLFLAKQYGWEIISEFLKALVGG